MIALDTNVLIRYIAQDDPIQSPRATKFIEKECSASQPGFIGLIALVECVWVSESYYGASRNDIAGLLQRLLSTKQLLVQDAETVWKALLLFESCQADFSDCLMERIAHAHGCKATVTFDKAAAKAGMRLL